MLKNVFYFIFITWYFSSCVVIFFLLIYWKTYCLLLSFQFDEAKNCDLIGWNIMLTCSYFVTVTKSNLII